VNTEELKADRRIREVIEEAERRRAAGADPDDAWFGTGSWAGKGLEAWVARVVGDERLGGPAALRTPEAYDVVTQHVLTILEEGYLACPWCLGPTRVVCVKRCGQAPGDG
jgi:hypothetical protein